MSYTVKEIFRTLQGEGVLTGRVAVFCRFTGCNLWSGRESDRAGAICKFCDTDFVGGERYADADRLAEAIVQEWGPSTEGRMVVLTGGEPTLQVDAALLAALKRHGFYIAIETNGTLPVEVGVDWICLSPKAGAPLRQTTASELKVVFPQDGLDPQALPVQAGVKSVQPMDGPALRENMAAAIAYCLANPQWRLATQAHKIWGVR